MKKHLSLIVCLVALAMAFLPQKTEAQVSTRNVISTTNSLARDTVTNAAAKIWMTPALSYANTVTIQVDVTKISGTLGGTVIPVGSNDGVTFYAAGAGTFTVTDVASQGILFAPPVGYTYYGVKWTGTGTMSGSLKATLVTKK
jgi:hypothetical protein